MPTSHLVEPLSVELRKNTDGAGTVHKVQVYQPVGGTILHKARVDQLPGGTIFNKFHVNPSQVVERLYIKFQEGHSWRNHFL
jgi:hypothetical protein